MAMRTKGERKKILVVEDDPELIRLHRDFLSHDFSVVIKSRGERAIRFLRNAPRIDLAVIDIKLPDISGIEVLREIKKRMPLVPAIIITAFGSEDIAVRAFRCGARDYVKKPFSYGDLLKRITACLSPPNVIVLEQAKHGHVLTAESEELAETFVRDANAAAKARMEQALSLIHNNYAADISLDRAAKAAGLSRYHFSRLFRKTTGMTYQGYVNRTRMEQARKLLADEALSITDVAYATGFADLTHFERIFKKVVGATPTQYRREQSR